MIISKIQHSVLLSLIPLLFVAACDSSGDAPGKRKGASAHLVETITAAIRPVSHQQILSGTLETANSIRLHNEEAGRIDLLPFYEGDAVKQGELLIAMDSEIIKAELDKAIAQRQQASLDYQRLKKLVPQKLASEEEVARSLTTLNIAKAEEQLQQVRMQRTRITAPFDGVISMRNNEPGDAVAARSHILSLIQPERLLVKVKVSAQWLTMISKGDAMQLSIDALGDTLHTAKVERIHPEIDAATRKGTVELVLEPAPDQARAGQLARVHFISQSDDRLVIPAYAIHHDIDGAYAYIVTSDDEGKTTAKKRYLNKGLQFGEWTEISSGIEIDDRLIVKGFLGLRDDKAVSIVNRANDEPAAINDTDSTP